MDSLKVKFNLANIKCFDEGDGNGNAEPYLWTVFFKIDGDTVSVNNQFMLQGTATVIGKPGNHNNLNVSDEGVDAGDVVPIPTSIGVFETILKPIPINLLPGKTIGGVAGCIAVLMEEDSTPDDAVAKGHQALNKSVQDALNGLIPTLGLGKEDITDEEVKELEKKITFAVESAIAKEVSFWDAVWGFLSFGNNQDEPIGTAKFFFSHDELEQAGKNGITLADGWADNGSWMLNGSVTVSKIVAAGICRSGDWANRYLFDMDQKSFEAETQKLFTDKGLRLVDVETYTVDIGKRRWAGICRSGNWANRFLIGMDQSSFLAETQKLFATQGLRLVNVETYVENGQRKWAGICRSGDWANRFLIGMDQKSFMTETQKLFTDKGLRLVDVETYIENGQRKWAGICRSGDWASRFLVNRGLETFLTETQELFDKQKLRLFKAEMYEI